MLLGSEDDGYSGFNLCLASLPAKAKRIMLGSRWVGGEEQMTSVISLLRYKLNSVKVNFTFVGIDCFKSALQETPEKVSSHLLILEIICPV